MAVEKSIGYYELKLEGGIVPLKFGIFGIEMYTQVVDIELSELYGYVSNATQKQPFTAIANILLAGAKNYAKFKSPGVDYTFGDAAGWVEELGINSDDITNAVKAFFESIAPVDAPDEDEEPDEIDQAKKKNR